MEGRGISAYSFMEGDGPCCAESILHEGLHLVVGRVSLDSKIWTLDAAKTCQNKHADRRELQTLAAEVVTLRYFGVSSDQIRKLIHKAIAANWVTSTLRMSHFRWVFRYARKLRAHQHALEILLYLNQDGLLPHMRKALRSV